MAITLEQLVQYGVPHGDAATFTGVRDMMFRQYLPGLRRHAATQAARAPAASATQVAPALALLEAVLFDDYTDPVLRQGRPAQPPLDLELTMLVEQLFAISEVDYSFEVQFRVVMSWHDTSIFRRCNGVDPWASEPVQCAEVWRPTIEFLNSDPTEGGWTSAEFFTEEAGWAKRFGGHGGSPTAFLIASYKGLFTAPMNFRDFPSDQQQLPIRLQLKHGPDPIRRSQLLIKPKCSLTAELAARASTSDGKDTLSGWNVVSASAREAVHNDVDFDALAGGRGAFDRYIEQMRAMNVHLTKVSETTSAEYVIHVARKARFFVLNYVLVVSMLTSISWLTFFLEPSALDERAGVTLTLLLAIGVFQLILNDSMPQTGYLTPMHTFILISSFYVAMALCESTVIYVLAKRQATKEAVVEKLTEHMPGFASGRRRVSPELGEGGGAAARTPLAADEASEARPPGAAAAAAEQRVGSGRATCGGAACTHAGGWAPWLVDHLDALSLAVFPVTYAIMTVALFG